MSTTQDTRRDTATPYAPPSARDALLQEALRCIVNGRPFPPELRVSEQAAAPVDDTETGIRRILAGPTHAP